MKTNPWLEVKLADYEGHMALPEVGQAALLASEFRRALERHDPGTVGLAGCAGGNGLDELVGTRVRRVVCVDINADFLESLARRYAGKIEGLETVCGEVEALTLEPPLDLVFGGLVFEYTRLDEALKALAAVIRDGGRLHALTQVKSAGIATVSPSPFARALSAVGESFNYVDVDEMAKLAAAHGLHEVERRVRTLESGKAFTITEFKKAVR